MYEKYAQAIQGAVIPHMEAVRSSGVTWSGELHFPAGALMQEAEKAGFTVLHDDMSTNGWQWDWWIDMEKEGVRYTLGGSGYYGGLTFSLSDD